MVLRRSRIGQLVSDGTGLGVLPVLRVGGRTADAITLNERLAGTFRQ